MMKMSRTAILLLSLTFACIARADVIFSSFEVEADAHRAVITWVTSTENDVTSFAVERSYDGVEFFPIATFTPYGPGREYRYVDVDLYKDSIRQFHYRIRAVDQMNREYLTEVKTVEISLSGIRQTWGSLKALFR